MNVDKQKIKDMTLNKLSPMYPDLEGILFDKTQKPFHRLDNKKLQEFTIKLTKRQYAEILHQIYEKEFEKQKLEEQEKIMKTCSHDFTEYSYHRGEMLKCHKCGYTEFIT